MAKLRIVIISGLSGSGKSYAIKCFEDMGFLCVDNLPTALVPKFAELSSQSAKGYKGVALGIDIRERDLAASFGRLHSELRKAGHAVELLYLDASDQVLVRRFSETRRPHPLSDGGTLVEAIARERALMQGVRARADRVLDTSAFTVHELKRELERLYETRPRARKITVSLVSFGFKHGVPYDADLVFDLRFLPNPNFVPELKELTGTDRAVQMHVRSGKETPAFMRRLMGFLDFLMPLYIKEGKTYLTIALGCTGGRHRSVAVAELLKKRFQARGLDILVRHRDKDR